MAFARLATLTSQNQAFQGCGFRLHCVTKSPLLLRNALRAPLQSLPHQKLQIKTNNSLNVEFFVKKIKAQADLQFVKIFGD